MNDLSRLSDGEVTDMLRRRSARPAPDGLASAVLESLATERARHPVRTADRSTRRPLVLLAAAALLIVGGALTAGSGLLRLPTDVPPVPEPSVNAAATISPDPTAPAVTDVAFFEPFEYVVPATSTLERTLATSRLYGFTEGSNVIYPFDPDGKLLPGTRGITVAVINDAVTHPCPAVNGAGSRVPIRSEPLEFLEDLRSISGGGLGIPTATTIDGRSGLSVDVLRSQAGCEAVDFHVLGGGLESGWVLLTIPTRLWLVEVNDSTVVVQAWAPTTEDLEAWLPVATEFIDSMRFISAAPADFTNYLHDFGQEFTPQPAPANAADWRLGIPSDFPIPGAKVDTAVYGVVTCVQPEKNCAMRGLVRPGEALPIWVLSFDERCPMWATIDARTGAFINGQAVS